jgi:threonine/homoserine/homoserine lactone efflux protein
VKTEGETLPKADAPWRMFATGLALTLGNPKIMMFYLALLPTIIDLGNVTLVGWVELTAAMVIVLMAIDIGWAVAASQARRFLRSPFAMRIANRVSATAMAGAAAAIASR